MLTATGRIIPAVDKMRLRNALNLVAAIGDRAPAYKVHAVAETNVSFVAKEFFREGAQGVWLDFKDFDMKDTVAERSAAAKDAGITMLSVHASGGPEMVEAAVKNGPPFIIGITVLSGFTPEMVEYLYNQPLDDVVVKLARWAKQGGAHALVCSPKQVGLLNQMAEFEDMIKIVPGTRSAGVAHHDQQQVDTPYNAIINGAGFLVGGRQITKAAEPLAAFQAMALEIAPAIEARIAASTWRS